MTTVLTYKSKDNCFLGNGKIKWKEQVHMCHYKLGPQPEAGQFISPGTAVSLNGNEWVIHFLTL